MLRRNARLRREYVYRKSVEARKARLDENKRLLKDSIKNESDLPTNMKSEALKLHDRIDWDEDSEDDLLDADIDDEYRWAGMRDPVVFITTSRKPGAKLKEFSKELRLIFPNSTKVNRGSYEVSHIVDSLRSHEATDLVIVNGNRSGPSSLTISHLPHGPTAVFTLHNVVMREELFKGEKEPEDELHMKKRTKKHMAQEYPHLSITGFNPKSAYATRAITILKHLFPVPKESSKRVVSMSAGAAGADSVSFRQYVYKWADKTPTQRDFKSRGKEIVLSEEGPRFEMQLYKIYRGSIDQHKTADIEFIQRPYMKTASKRLFIAAPHVADGDNEMPTTTDTQKKKKR